MTVDVYMDLINGGLQVGSPGPVTGNWETPREIHNSWNIPLHEVVGYILDDNEPVRIPKSTHTSDRPDSALTE